MTTKGRQQSPAISTSHPARAQPPLDYLQTDKVILIQAISKKKKKKSEEGMLQNGLVKIPSDCIYINLISTACLTFVHNAIVLEVAQPQNSHQCFTPCF